MISVNLGLLGEVFGSTCNALQLCLLSSVYWRDEARDGGGGGMSGERERERERERESNLKKECAHVHVFILPIHYPLCLTYPTHNSLHNASFSSFNTPCKYTRPEPHSGQKQNTIHQLTTCTVLSTSKNVLYPGHNHLLTTGADDPSL